MDNKVKWFRSITISMTQPPSDTVEGDCTNVMLRAAPRETGAGCLALA